MFKLFPNDDWNINTNIISTSLLFVDDIHRHLHLCKAGCCDEAVVWSWLLLLKQPGFYLASWRGLSANWSLCRAREKALGIDPAWLFWWCIETTVVITSNVTLFMQDGVYVRLQKWCVSPTARPLTPSPIPRTCRLLAFFAGKLHIDLNIY